jgi:hypothetical protein
MAAPSLDPFSPSCRMCGDARLSRHTLSGRLGWMLRLGLPLTGHGGASPIILVNKIPLFKVGCPWIVPIA